MSKGLIRPSNNFVVLQLLENYVPMAFSTLAEPFLVLLARILCILQPFRELHVGKASAAHTIETKYDSLPPQLVIVRALRSRHFLLATVCWLALLANGLAVSLGGIFNEDSNTISFPATFQQPRSFNFTRDEYVPVGELGNGKKEHSHFHVLWANVSSNTSLPPWTTPGFAFLPLVGMPEASANSTIFRAQTRGYGVESMCSPFSTSPSDREHVNMTGILDGLEPLSFRYQHDNGSWTTCYHTTSEGFNPESRSAREVVAALEPWLGIMPWAIPGEAGFCQDRLLLGWLRAESNKTGSNVESTFVQCKAVIRTGMFNVTFRPSGRVVDYEKLGNLEDITKFTTGNRSTMLLREANQYIGEYSRAYGVNRAWHNETYATDWVCV